MAIREMKVMVALDQKDLPDSPPPGTKWEAGDTKIVWDSDKPDEVGAARDTFNKLKKKGYLAFSVRDKGHKGDQINEFDPDAEKLIMAPPMAGG